MKLYTEEQMIRAFNYGKTLEPFDCFEDMIKSLKPIKISSDNTAIDWVIEQLRKLAHNPNTHLGMGDIRVTQGYIDEIEEQAKAMEKEQIKNAHLIGLKTSIFMKETKQAEQYYNETYGK